MDKISANYGKKNIESIKSSNKIQKPLKSQNFEAQSKFCKIYHDELKARGICRNL